MDVKEKRKVLTEYCQSHDCGLCELFGRVNCNGCDTDFVENIHSDCEIIGAFQLIFGKDEIETAELKEAAIIPDTIHIDKVENLYLTINHFNYEEDR